MSLGLGATSDWGESTPRQITGGTRSPRATLVAFVVLTVLAAPLPPAAAVLADSQPTPPAEGTPLLPGKIIDRALAGGQSHTYQISLSAGQSATLTVEQKGLDVLVQIVDPASNPLADFDFETRPLGEEHVAFVAESTGAYRVLVKAKYAKDPAAAYAISLLEIRPATQQDQLLFKARKLSAESQVENDAGNYAKALDLAQQSLALSEQALAPNDAYIGWLAARLGSAQFTEGDREKAAASFRRAIGIDEAAGNNQQLALALQGLGKVYIDSNDYPKAEEVLRQSRQITEKVLGSDSPGAANCLVSISLLHQRRGDFPRALNELQRALAIDQKRLDPDDLAIIRVMDSLGDLYFEVYDYEKAVPILQQTLSLTEQKFGPNHPAATHPLQNLGIIARERGQYPLALEYLWRAEKIREKALGSQHPATGSLLVNIGNVYNSQGDYPRAIETYLRALTIMQTTEGPYHEWTLMTLGNLARAYAAQGDSADAVKYMARMQEAAETNLSLNLAIGSERDRLVYAEKFAAQTSRVISLNVTVAPNDPTAADLAAQMILQRKGRVLDSVADSMTALRRRLEPADQKLLNELNSTVAELAKADLQGPGPGTPEQYQAQLEALRGNKERLETEISRRSAGYYQRTDAVTLAAVQKVIPAASVLVEFAVYEPYDFRQAKLKDYDAPRYVVYLISPQGDVRWRDLGAAKQIDDQIDAYRLALRDPKRSDARQIARELDEKIMQPVRSMGAAGKHLIISPDGELNLLPFESLLDEHGNYLIENYLISYVTAGRDLLRMQVARPGKSEPEIFANPAFGDPATEQSAASSPPKLGPAKAFAARRGSTTGQDFAGVYFAPLAGTAQEAHVLKSLFPDAKILSGEHASKAELERVEAPTILHLATHGFFLENAADNAASNHTVGKGVGRSTDSTMKTENPLLRSGLALAGANLGNRSDGNGILTALEASNLNLWGTKLVTLSACDTGVGQVENGEGVFGLRRAFVIAGAETVVMSLWPISDAVTRDLMTSYYRGLKAGLGRGDALRQAQLAILNRKGHEHPFYWASFIQVGEWANLDGKR
jgi:CHAT domain-containing protein/lipopolysaccharide biosynthesis regulator YciM